MKQKFWMVRDNEVVSFHYNKKGERVDIRKAKMSYCFNYIPYADKSFEPFVKFEDDYGNVLRIRLEILDKKVINSFVETTRSCKYLTEKVEYICKGKVERKSCWVNLPLVHAIVNQPMGEDYFEIKIKLSHNTIIERYEDCIKESTLNEIKKDIEEYTFEDFLKLVKPSRRELCRIAYPFSKQKVKSLENLCNRFWNSDFSKRLWQNNYYVRQMIQEKNKEFCYELETLAKEKHKNHL